MPDTQQIMLQAADRVDQLVEELQIPDSPDDTIRTLARRWLIAAWADGAEYGLRLAGEITRGETR